MATLRRAQKCSWRIFHNLKYSSRKSINNTSLRWISKSPYLSGVDPITLEMPALSPTMTEGTIKQWLKHEGESVQAGDALCEIETDKATVMMDADEDGILAKILLPEGSSNVPISAPIALMVAEGEDWKDVNIPDFKVPSTSPETSMPPPEQTKADPEPVTHREGGVLSPAVRQLVETHNLDPSKIPASGPHGILLKGDVLRFMDGKVAEIPSEQAAPEPGRPSAAPLPPPEQVAPPPITRTQDTFEDIELTNIRKVIAARLSESKEKTPHVYATIDCTLDEILKLRKQLKKEDIKVSVNDFIIKAVAVTLKKVQGVNCFWQNDTIVPFDTIDISVAVATDRGLITPIVRNADSKGLTEIGAEVKVLAGKAREGKLQPQEFQGGTFTISNLGMFGITEFTAVINPPQSCIMAVGGSQLAVKPDGKPSTFMTVQLSSDARVIDNPLASQFLTEFKRNMENPVRIGLL